MPTQPIILSERTELREKLQNSAEHFRNLSNNAYQAFKNLNLGPITLEALHQIKSRHVEALLRELVYQQTDFLKNSPIEKSAALNMAILPAGWQQLKTALESLETFTEELKHGRYSKIPLAQLGIVKDQVVIAASFEAYLDSRTRRVASAEEMQLHAACQAVYEQLQTIEASYPSVKLIEYASNPNSPNSIFYTSRRTGQIIFNQRSIHID